MSASVTCSVTINNGTSTKQLHEEGTLDFWWVCNQTATDIPLRIAPINVVQKLHGLRQLHRGFMWRIGGGGPSAIVQTVSRTLAVDARYNEGGFGVSSASKTGFFQIGGTGIYGSGFMMALPAPSWQKRRLKCYTTDFDAIIVGTAKVMDGDNVEATATDTSPGTIGTDTLHYWTIDYQGGTNRSWMIFEFILTAKTVGGGANQNFGIQGFTLAVAP